MSKGLKWLLGFIIFSALIWILNSYVLFIPTFQIVGIILGGWIALWFIIHFIIKAKNKDKEKEKYTYTFSEAMAKNLKSMDLRTQYEASLLATFFILIGILLMNVYIIFFADFSNWFKFFTAFNSFWGFVFLGSSLVTQYQGYVSYMETMDSLNMIKNMKGGNG